MSIDNVTIIGSAIVLFLALVTPFLNGLFRIKGIDGLEDLKGSKEPENSIAIEESDSSEETDDSEGTDGSEESANTGEVEESAMFLTPPAISIILTPHENAVELEHNLPLLLGQKYHGDFQVVVVIWKGDSETEDVLKRFAGDSRLYYTYIPDSSRYMSRKKLAITLGVKAARYEWLLLTDAECRPTSNYWLQKMARNCTNDKNLVIGYTCYDDMTSDYRRFERLHTAFYLIREDVKSTAYRHNGSNLMFRKSMFIDGDGFRGNLKYLRGEYDFLVNKYAEKTETALEIARDAWMVEQEPTEKGWRNKHLFYIENRQHMQRSFRHRLLFNIDQMTMHLNYLVTITILVFSLLTQRWLLTGAAGIALLITVVLRTLIGNKAIKLFDNNIPSWKIVPYEISLLWNNLRFMLKYMRADKYDFISHKL